MRTSLADLVVKGKTILADGSNGPAEIEGALQSMQAAGQDVLITAKSNAGMPHLVDGVPVYDASPEDMAVHALRARELGAQIIGACCSSTPAYIQAMADALQNEGLKQ